MYGELWFAKRARDADDSRVADANRLAAEANRVAEEERHARVKLEAELQPRTLTPEQIAAIRGLRDKFPEINVAREVNIEAHMFAGQIVMALMAAGIRVRQFLRAPEWHTAAIHIYDPLGFDRSGPRSTGPLCDVFLGQSVIGFVEQMPPDIPASAEVPMIIVGGHLFWPSGAFSAYTDLAKLLDEDRKPNNSATNTKPPHLLQ